MPESPRSLVAAAWRFAAAGLLNTALTGVALTLLALVIDPTLAYVIVFLAGIGLSTYLAHRFVYGVPLGRNGTIAYVLMYLVVFVVGLGVIELMKDAGLPGGSSGLVVLVTAPLTFVGGRIITRVLHDRRTTTTDRSTT
ncbi:MAG: GtrA family protein [Cellulomonas sp.]